MQLVQAQQTLETVVIEGATYYIKKDGSLELMRPVDPINPDNIAIYTLQGLVDFIKADIDHKFVEDDYRYIVSVKNHNNVELLSPLSGEKNERKMLASCDAKAPEIEFDEYLDPETMNVMLMTRFQESEIRTAILAIVGNMVSDQSVQTADDGFSQRVTIKKGVATNGTTTIRNPVMLTPIRTFHEVEQPESPFVLRMNDKHEVALFEADGGAWKIAAVKNIRDWLRLQLEGANVEVIA
jgi:hypothetical protein